MTFGGVVIDYVVRLDKSGKSFGKIVLEDKTGTYELMLFGHNYVDYGKYGIKGEFLMVNGAFQRSKFNQSKVNFNITSIDLMQDVKGRMIHNIEIDINPDDISVTKSKVLASFLTGAEENASELIFNVIDGSSGKIVRLVSDKRIPVTKELIDYLDENNWNYRIEGREKPNSKRSDVDAENVEDEMAQLVVDD